MRSITIVRDYSFALREAATLLLLSVLLLVTGCSSTQTAMRTELAPPPPFMAMEDREKFGPDTPVEIAMLRVADSIEPSSGESEACGFMAEGNPVGFGLGKMPVPAADLSFASLHSGADSTSLVATFTMKLPSPVAEDDCR